MEGYMKRVLTTLALGFGLTVGAVFAANAAPSVVITPGAHTVVATSSVATPSVPRATGSNSHGHGHGGSSGGGSGSSNRRSSSVSTLSSSAGTWVKDAHGWWLNYGAGNYAKNTWVFKDSKWYYFNADGYMYTSWLHINNNWYYLHDDGHMNIGWLLTENTHKWYYFDANGAMWYNATTPDGYYVNNDGVYVAK
jgi:hypothetical protein